MKIRLSTRTVLYLALLFLMSRPAMPVWALGINGALDLRYSTSKQDVEGTGKTDGYIVTENYYINASGDFTPVISWTAHLRASDNKTSTTQNSLNTKSFRRGIEPQFEINLNNPMYRASLGYQRTETWDGASLSNENRRTNDFTYARFDVAPVALPTLGLQWSHRKNFDYDSPHLVDITTDTYLLTTTYTYAPLTLFYNYYLTKDADNAASGTLTGIDRTSHSHNGRIDYNKSFYSGRIPVTASYQANYNRNITSISSTAAVVTIKRTPSNGLYAPDSSATPDPIHITLPDQPSLVNGDKKTPTTINLHGYNGTSAYNIKQQNIGLQLISVKSVRSLRLYTNVLKTELTNVPKNLTFAVYWSTTNTAPTLWTLIPSSTSAPPLTSAIEDVYFYDINFTATPAKFFKVVVDLTAADATTNDIYVTEIEAYGDETEKTDKTERLDQGLNFNTGFQATPDLSVAFNMYVTRNEEEPKSLPSAAGNLFSNIVSKSNAGSEGTNRATTNRSFGPSINWRPYSRLFTSFRYQRQDSWDTQNTIDSNSNSYAFTLNSPVLETLDTTFSATRTEQYNFSQKQTVNNALLLSTIAKLYEDVSMITDLNYTVSKQYQTNVTTDTIFLNGNINAIMTRTLNGTFTYGFSWPSPGQPTNNQALVLVYHPSSLLSVTGTLQTADTGTDRIFGPSLRFDWLPFPVLNLSLAGQYMKSGDTKNTSITAQSRWQINRYIDWQLNYTFGTIQTTTETTTHTFSTFLDARF